MAEVQVLDGFILESDGFSVDAILFELWKQAEERSNKAANRKEAETIWKTYYEERENIKAVFHG